STLRPEAICSWRCSCSLCWRYKPVIPSSCSMLVDRRILVSYAEDRVEKDRGDLDHLARRLVGRLESHEVRGFLVEVHARNRLLGRARVLRDRVLRLCRDVGFA